MDELIKKDSALEICDRWRRRANAVHDRKGFYIANIIYEQMEELEDARPRGEWIYAHEGTIAAGYYCSVCGEHGYRTRCCSNCGAYMKGTKDEVCSR